MLIMGRATKSSTTTKVLMMKGKEANFREVLADLKVSQDHLMATMTEEMESQNNSMDRTEAHQGTIRTELEISMDTLSSLRLSRDLKLIGMD